MSGLSDSDIKELLHRFYSHVRSDHLLGPVFNGIVADWTEHLVRLEEFWSSLMRTSGRYKGNPVTMHTMHAQQLRPEMFHRWLAIWQATTSDMLSTEDAAAMQVKAGRIAQRLQRAIFSEEVVPLSKPAVSPERVPFRTTAMFDEISLPAPLLKPHRSPRGVWVRIVPRQGRILVHFVDRPTNSELVSSEAPRLIPPEQTHHYELVGPVTLAIEFYDGDPSITFKS